MKFYSLSVCVECMYLCARVCRCVYTCACAQKFRGQCWFFFHYDTGVFRGQCWWSFSMTHHLIFHSLLFQNFIYAKCVLMKAIHIISFRQDLLLNSLASFWGPPASNSFDTRILTTHRRLFVCSLQTRTQVLELAQQAFHPLRELLAWTFLLL